MKRNATRKHYESRITELELRQARLQRGMARIKGSSGGFFRRLLRLIMSRGGGKAKAHGRGMVRQWIQDNQKALVQNRRALQKLQRRSYENV